MTPRSNYIGDKAFPGMVTDSGSLVVLAVQRHGVDLGIDEIELRAGDSLLLQGGWDALDEHTLDPNVILVDSPDAIRRQTVPLGPKAKPALIVLGGHGWTVDDGLVPAVVACMLAAIAMVLLRTVTLDQAHRSMSWTTLILVGGHDPAIDRDHGDRRCRDAGGPDRRCRRGRGSYVLVARAVSDHRRTGSDDQQHRHRVDPDSDCDLRRHRDVGVADGGADVHQRRLRSSLLTPVATPANMMVMGPGGYKFGDYWKLGLPILGVYLLVAVFVVPIFWPL